MWEKVDEEWEWRGKMGENEDEGGVWCEWSVFYVVVVCVVSVCVCGGWVGWGGVSVGFMCCVCSCGVVCVCVCSSPWCECVHHEVEFSTESICTEISRCHPKKKNKTRGRTFHHFLKKKVTKLS